MQSWGVSRRTSSAGCRALNDVDFSKGYTPLLSATARYKAGVCAVLKHFGANTEARDIENKQTADEMANWLRFPIEKGSDECLRVLREEVDFASYAGIQWIYSEEIQNDLRKLGINIVMPNADRPNETDLDLGVLIKLCLKILGIKQNSMIQIYLDPYIV